ncbi:MAG: ATP-binding protein, partial [Candidatus Competibacteraceae bacterium]|nr:ATP-binding protein [Candidatus Competibacteraceae bacterium]
MANPIPWYHRLELTTDPFAPGPARNGWVLATPQWRIQADSLIKTALAGSFVGLIKGDMGSGKTTLLHQVMESLTDWPQVRLLPIACRNDISLLRGLAPDKDLGLDPYPALLEHLDRQCREGLRPLALIDDAHLLSRDELEMLVRLSQPRDQAPALLHTLMFADAAIQSRLNEL